MDRDQERDGRLAQAAGTAEDHEVDENRARDQQARELLAIACPEDPEPGIVRRPVRRPMAVVGAVDREYQSRDPAGGRPQARPGRDRIRPKVYLPRDLPSGPPGGGGASASQPLDPATA